MTGFGAEHATRPGVAAQSVRRLPGQCRAGAGQQLGARARWPSGSSSPRPGRGREVSEVSGPGFINLTFRRLDQRPGEGRDERLGVPPGCSSRPRRLLRAERGQGDACRPPPHHRRGRRTRPHAGTLATASSGRTTSATGARRSACSSSTCSTSARTPTTPSAGHRPQRVLRAASAEFDGDAEFATRARSRVVTLQAGDAEHFGYWRELVELSKQYFNRIYTPLGVTLTDRDLAGESTYNDELTALRRARGAGHRDDQRRRALRVPRRLHRPRGQAVPLIIRKSDGGYGYATTDLATIRHRVRHSRRPPPLRRRAPQALHLNMVWDTARKPAGCPRRQGRARPDRQRARRGPQDPAHPRRAPLRLMALLEEAVATARAVVDEARPDLDEASVPRSRRRSGSVRSSTPTSRSRTTASTSSTSTGWSR